MARINLVRFFAVATVLTACAGPACAADYAQYSFRDSRNTVRPSIPVEPPALQPAAAEYEMLDPEQAAEGIQHAVDYVDPLVKDDREREAMTQTGLKNTTPTLLDDFPSGTHLDEFGDWAKRYTLRHDAGSGIGYQNSFTRVNMFIPILEESYHHLLFADITPFVDNVGNFGLNAGGGVRYYSENLGRVFGVYGHFDYDERNYNSYRGGTIGVDSLGDMFDFRANLYAPSTNYKAITERFTGNAFVVGRERAFQGGDIEVGVVLPEISGTQSRIYAGLYTFDTDSSENMDGYKVRLETYWCKKCYTDIQYYDDEYNGSTVVVGFAVYAEPRFHGIANQATILPKIRSFRNGEHRHITRTAMDRLAEPIWRLPRIATIKELF